jgi:hypothetical protein
VKLLARGMPTAPLRQLGGLAGEEAVLRALVGDLPAHLFLQQLADQAGDADAVSRGLEAGPQLFLSACVDRISVRYLVSGATPEPGTICDADVVPFQQPAGAVARTPRSQLIRNLVPGPWMVR